MIERNGFAMIAGGLALIVAFAVGGYILGFGLGEQSGEYEANADTYARHAQDEINSACAGLDATAQTECIVRVVEATNEHKRAESNLKAQRDMARLALWMLAVTIVMAIVTAGGVYYVWQTINVTREIGEAQVRAYQSVKGIEILESNDKTRMGIILSAGNDGQSPALDSDAVLRVLFQVGGEMKEVYTAIPIGPMSAGVTINPFAIEPDVGTEFASRYRSATAARVDAAIYTKDIFGKINPSYSSFATHNRSHTGSWVFDLKNAVPFTPVDDFDPFREHRKKWK
ncbi:hypothetical protein PL335_06480 [Sulfitobacter faviae]|uniref:hypothetical protein n=1 Tax=Sulfitobacter faviae TaxID=1775881 RepID=UPI00230728C3|nr:hypothetical protein [Sulfitobacter faviae]WCE67989.1 hypothetical protein PL335_06480 [Sulfitobacter faviae]